MLEHRQATDGRNPSGGSLRHSAPHLYGTAPPFLLFTRVQVLVKVPRLVAPTGESKLSSASRGHKVLKDFAVITDGWRWADLCLAANWSGGPRLPPWPLQTADRRGPLLSGPSGGVVGPRSPTLSPVRRPGRYPVRRERCAKIGAD